MSTELLKRHTHQTVWNCINMRQNKGHYIKVISAGKLITGALTLHQRHEEVSRKDDRTAILNIAVRKEKKEIVNKKINKNNMSSL